jgi:hypothetical protein
MSNNPKIPPTTLPINVPLPRLSVVVLKFGWFNVVPRKKFKNYFKNVFSFCFYKTDNQ